MSRPTVPSSMKLTVPAEGTTWRESVAEILAHWHSTDIGEADLDIEAVGVSLTKGYRDGLWRMVLDEKRGDDHYPDVLDSVRTFGFLRPSTCRLSSDGRHFVYGDGHHRLAAAIDLSLTSIPVQFFSKGLRISNDSGEWYMGMAIPTSNSTRHAKRV